MTDYSDQMTELENKTDDLELRLDSLEEARLKAKKDLDNLLVKMQKKSELKVIQNVDFNEKYIEENRDNILEIKLSLLCLTSYPCWHSVTFRLKGMKEDEWMSSDKSVHATKLLEFYHLMDQEDREHMVEYFENKHFTKYVDIVVDKLLKENDMLKKKNEELELEIRFQPGGLGYQEAKENFDSLKN
jgi:NAD-dependent SIR2 family protein deacetylase